MRLKTLALQGFKTFVQRTSVEFDTGITAIVGPNGSGKSNLADAFRWTIGEQNIRTLRGRRTDDVLFAGGRGRPPSGFAEVSLTFDIESQHAKSQLDLPYAEISVARRAYRSGENEYYLNRNRVRLRDISSLLGQIGLDVDGFNVVGQGMVESALSLRPGDRRMLVEQAAGIGYLQTRLDESQTRLEQTYQNLERATDVLAELQPRLRSLERQVKLARERDMVQNELGRLVLRWYAHLWSGPSSKLHVASSELSQIATKSIDAREALRRHDSETTSTETDVARVEKELAEAVCLHQVEQERYLALSSQIAADDQRLALMRARQVELATALDHWRTAIGEERSGLDDVAARRQVVMGDIDRTEAELADRRKELHIWSTLRRDLEGRIDESRQRLVAVERSMTVSKAQLQAMEDRRVDLTRLLDEHDNNLLRIEQEFGAAQRAVDECQAASNCAEGDQAALAARYEQAEHDWLATRQALDLAAAALAAVDRELQTSRARADAVSSVESSGAGYSPGVRAILRATSGSSSARLNGVIGIVSQLFDVPPGIELAVEVALGGHGQDIVVERWNDAEKAIAYLKSSNIGRATFLPLDSLRSPRPADAPSGPGIVGVASNLVQVAVRLKLVANFLLGQTLIVEDLSVAHQCLAGVSPGWQVVTLAGDIARSSGLVTGGAPPTSRGQLARFRELRESRRSLEDLASRRVNLSGTKDHAQAIVDRNHSVVNDLHRQLTVERERGRSLAIELAKAESTRNRLGDQLERQKAELLRLSAEHRAAEHRRREIQVVLDEGESERQFAMDSLRHAEDALTRFISDTNDLATLTRESHDALNLSRQRLLALDEDARRGESRLTSLDQRAREAVGQIEVIEKSIADIVARVGEARRIASASDVSVRRADLNVATLRAEAGKLHHQRDRRAAQRSSLESDLQAFAHKQQRAEQNVDRLIAELNGIRQQVALELGPIDEDQGHQDVLVVRLQDGTIRQEIACPLPDAGRVQERMASLRSRLRTLPSGSDFVLEYETLKERIEGLTRQCDDLSRTASTLGDAIAETHETMRVRFDQTFADVSVRFSQRFADLFGGGTARLAIESDRDVAGVEVYAQPPGKRSQSLVTLSGGERALTAAALLFALIEANPPPFCVLDEVDAALDENNVLRFSSCLRELTPRTQFVVITHNRRTMEAATAIYGFTLEDRCETRVISMRLPGEASSSGIQKA